MHQHPKSAMYGQSSGPDVTGAGLSCARFADVEEQAAALTGWNQSYMQTSSGLFFGEVRQIQCEGVRLFIEDLQQSVMQTGCLGAEQVAIGVPLRMLGRSVFCGEPSDEETLYVFSGATGFEFHSPSSHLMLGIEIEERLFAGLRCGTENGLSNFGQQAHLYAAGGPALNELRQFLLGLFNAVEAMPGLLSEAPVQSGVVDALLQKLSHVVHGQRAERPGGRLSGRQRLVERVRDLVETRLSAPPSIAELCAMLEVSRRTLQTAFQESLGVGPLAYLRIARLNAVRQALKSADSVTCAATSLGFWHFGHFAHDYRVMFGELPSDTFRRYHSLSVRRDRAEAACLHERQKTGSK